MEKFDFHSLLIIDAHLLSPVGATLPRRKANARVVVPLLRSSYFCVHVYPGFHIGLCPHSTLGYEEVSCLKALTTASPNKSNNLLQIDD